MPESYHFLNKPDPIYIIPQFPTGALENQLLHNYQPMTHVINKLSNTRPLFMYLNIECHTSAVLRVSSAASNVPSLSNRQDFPVAPLCHPTSISFHKWRYTPEKPAVSVKLPRGLHTPFDLVEFQLGSTCPETRTDS